MTSLALASFTDGFTVAPTQRTFHARTGITYTSGDTLAHTAYEWWLFRNGVLIDSCFAGGVYSTLCVEPGDYTLICRIFCASGGYATATAEDRVDWTVGVASIDVALFVDSAAGSDANPGTEASPKQTIAGAASAIGSAWVSNGEHRIYLRAGQTHSCSGTTISYTNRAGRIIVDRYGDGAKPDIVHTGSGHFLILNNAIVGGVVNCQTHGGRTGTGTKNGNFVYKQNNDPTNSSLGPINVVLHNVDCYGWDRLFELWHLTTITKARVDAGYADNIAVVGCTAHNSREYHHYYSFVQNLLIRDCYLGDYYLPSGGGLIRLNGYNRVYIRGVTEPLTRTDAGASLRVHGTSVEGDLAYDGRDIVVTECKLASILTRSAGASNTRNRYTWITYNRIDSRNLASPANDEPISNASSYCWIHGNRILGFTAGISFTYFHPDYVGPTIDVWAANNNIAVSRVSEYGRPFSGPRATGTGAPSPTLEGLYVYNNAARKIDETTQGQWYEGGSKTVGADWESDYNLLQFNGSPAPWSRDNPTLTGPFGRATLAQWQAAGKETNSAQGVNLNFASVTVVDDLVIGSGSDAIDAGTPMLYARVDCFGKLRDPDGWDVGAHERGSTDEPVPPSIGGGGTRSPRKRVTISAGVGI